MLCAEFKEVEVIKEKPKTKLPPITLPKLQQKSEHVVRDSLHALELSPLMKKKLMDEIKAPPEPVKKKQSSMPWTVADRIKRLLKANKAGIWVSRFQLEYKVCKRSSVTGLDCTLCTFD